MSVEFELLRTCLGSGDSSPRLHVADWVEQRGLEWHKLFSLARVHGVVAPLYLALRDYRDDIPPESFALLTREYHNAVGRSAFVTAELTRILGIFQEGGIDVIPYKGPVLSEQIFGQSVIRESKDLDLVLHKADIIRARDLLIENGYQKDMVLSQRAEAFLLSSRKESSYDLRLPFPSGGGKQLKIELHWKIPLTSVVPPEWYWQGLETRRFQGQEILVFPIETLLIILLAHGFRHYWESLKWLSDIDLLVRRTEAIQWDTFLSESTRLGVRRVVAFGLLLSREYLGTPLPKSIESVLEQEERVRRLIPGALQNLYGLQRCPVGAVNNFWIRERLRDRFYYLRNILDYLFVPDLPDFLRFPLPRPLWPVYWVLRPLKVLTCFGDKYGRRVGLKILLGKRGK